MPKKGSIKLPEAQLVALCDAITQSIPFNSACVLAGMPQSTFYFYKAEAEELREAITKGRRRKPKSVRGLRLLEFLERIKKAEAAAIKRNILAIALAGTNPKHWAAAAWLLERRYPDEYGKQRLDVTVKEGPNQMTLDKMIEVVMQKTEGHPELRRELAHAFDEIAKAEEANEGGE